MTDNKTASLFAYTFSHFCVDFACFFMLFHGFRTKVATLETLALGFLIYNMIAFGLQPLIGYLSDMRARARGNIPIAVYGCCFIILGLVLLSVPWVSLMLCELGNACFHVGGGRDSLIHANGKMSRSGIFVSSGALGVSLGTIVGKSPNIPLIVPVLLLSVSFILIICFERSRKVAGANENFGNPTVTRAYSLVLPLCLLAVVIRSYAGSVIPMEWQTTVVFMLFPSIGACVGKAAGGYLADRFGAKNVGVVTLLGSIPLLGLGYHNPFFCTIGILLFNMTMPITLWAVASRLPLHPGLAFGLTTLGLLGGNVPTFFYRLPATLAIPVIAILIILAAVFIFISVINQKGALDYEKIHQAVEPEVV